MKEKEVSKYLSLVLRHQPEALGVVLDEQGWTSVTILLEKLQAKGRPIDLDVLKQVVANNDKQRFAFNADFSQIRANQGHSVKVDLGLQAVQPPEYLYHGTCEANLAAILQEGIKKQSRQQVHLSTDLATALKVGQRHGKSVVLLVQSGKLHQDGGVFYLSENDVWLTDFIAPEYLKLASR